MDNAEIEAALQRRIQTRIAAQGSIRLPAIPAMADDYTDRCAQIFSELGRPFTDSERAHLRTVIAGQLAEAFAQSQRSSIVVSYESRTSGPIEYHVTTICLTIEDAYHEWIATREPPLFGVEPDARIWKLVSDTDDPAGYRILDIGAGTGRNALALARRGHPVDAVEMTPKFAEIIKFESEKAALDLKVIQRDIFGIDAELRNDYSLVILSEVVPEFRTTAELRRMFELAAQSLRPTGQLAFNIFLAAPGYHPSATARQFAQQAYSGFFTRLEVDEALSGLPLTLATDDCVFEYEQTNLPHGAWPPTSWYAGWVSGHDIFGLSREQCPVDMHWLVYRRT